MVYFGIGRFDNETVVNSDAKALLTGADTFSNYETTAQTATRRDITLDGTYSGTGTSTEVFIDPDLEEGTGTGQLEHADNLTTRGAVISSLETFDMGTIATLADGTTDYNGTEVAIARERRARLSATFTNDEIRFFVANVAITQASPSIVGVA